MTITFYLLRFMYSWFHFECSSLTKKQFQSFCLDKSLQWFCTICLENLLPFQSLTNNKLLTLLHDPSFWSVTSCNAFNPLKMSHFERKCSVCNKQVRDVVKSIRCQICHCLIHQRCSGFRPWESANFSKAVKYWSCKQSYVDQFPFSTLETNDLLDLTFNSNFICPCRHSCVDIHDYQLLEKLELCKVNHSEYDSLFDNDIDNHVRFHDNFDYFSNHKFHKLIKNISLSGKERFSLLHTKISSLLGNFDKLESLLLDLDSDFDLTYKL